MRHAGASLARTASMCRPRASSSVASQRLQVQALPGPRFAPAATPRRPFGLTSTEVIGRPPDPIAHPRTCTAPAGTLISDGSRITALRQPRQRVPPETSRGSRGRSPAGPDTPCSGSSSPRAGGERHATEPFHAASPDPAGHHGAEREAMVRRNGAPLSSVASRTSGLIAFSRSIEPPKPNRCPWRSTLSSPDELDESRLRFDAGLAEYGRQRDAPPASRADRLGSPRQLARQRADRQILVASKTRTDQGGRNLQSRKCTQIVEREAERAVDQTADLEPPGVRVDAMASPRGCG